MNLLRIGNKMINLDLVEQIAFDPAGTHYNDPPDRRRARPILWIDFHTESGVEGRNYTYFEDGEATRAWAVLHRLAIVDAELLSRGPDR